jgi:excisionase family DNA binding protein
MSPFRSASDSTSPPALLTRAEASRFLSLSPRKLDQLAASGELPRVKIGAAVRFDPADLEAFVAAAKQGGPS